MGIADFSVFFLKVCPDGLATQSLLEQPHCAWTTQIDLGRNVFFFLRGEYANAALGPCENGKEQ